MSAAVTPKPGEVGRRPVAVKRASSGFARTSRGALAAFGRIPRAGRACFAIAFVNAAIWGVVVPPFQVPDEIAHFAYAQYLAETGKLPPQGSGAQYSPQEQTALNGLNFYSVIGRQQMRGIFTSQEDRQLRSLLAAHPSPVGEGGSDPVTNQPPLYYALEAIPYWLSPSHDILARLAFMRLLSALMAAGTASLRNDCGPILPRGGFCERWPAAGGHKQS